MAEDRLEPLLDKLAATRQTLLAVLENMPPDNWEKTLYSEGATWTASDVLRHLVSAQYGMIRLIQVIQEGGEGVPPDFDRDRYNQRSVEKARDKNPAQLIQQLQENRSWLLTILPTLVAEDWEKKGRHASGRFLTIAEIVAVIADHEQIHAHDLHQLVN